METRNVYSATVKADGRTVKVYKIKDKDPDGKTRYNIYFGDEISLEKVYAGSHNEQFTEDELTGIVAL